jgi:hypothetical protein
VGDDVDPGTLKTQSEKKTGPKPKYGKAMTSAERSQAYRQRKYKRTHAAAENLTEASMKALLDYLHELTVIGKHPRLIHAVLDEIARRFPVPSKAAAKG